MLKRIMTAGVGGIAIVVLAAGCSKVVPANNVASDLKSFLQSQGMTASSTSCPNDLNAAVGASENCTATINGQKQTFTATVSKFDGTTATIDFGPAGGGSSSSNPTDNTGSTSNPTDNSGSTSNPTDNTGSTALQS
jgi:hypothetical protein